MHPRLWVEARCKVIIETILKVTTQGVTSNPIHTSYVYDSTANSKM